MFLVMHVNHQLLLNKWDKLSNYNAYQLKLLSKNLVMVLNIDVLHQFVHSHSQQMQMYLTTIHYININISKNAKSSILPIRQEKIGVLSRIYFAAIDGKN